MSRAVERCAVDQSCCAGDVLATMNKSRISPPSFGLPGRNPTEGVILPEAATKPKPTVAATREEVQAILTALKGKPVARAAAGVMEFTGVRGKPADCAGKSGTALSSISMFAARSGTGKKGSPRQRAVSAS